MIILGIETSCDETALALIETSDAKEHKPKVSTLHHVVLSQAKIHKEYGGVFPNVAKREHAANLVPVFKVLLEESKIKTAKPVSLSKAMWEQLETILKREPKLFEGLLDFLDTTGKPHIDLIAVTEGPGLEPALWVGVNFAKALSALWEIPVMPINHMEGHIAAAVFEEAEKNIRTLSPLAFPALALLISGGHTELVLVSDWHSYKILGRTRDDAVGEAFDKVARILGLPYPGGPEISKLADKARARGGKLLATLPRPMIKSDDFDFSFSGLKTAVLYMAKEIKVLTDEMKENIAREFEDAAAEVLVSKTRRAAIKFGAKSLIVGGGVIANKHIRQELETLPKEIEGLTLYKSSMDLSTDNALMIALAAYLRLLFKNDKAFDKNFGARGNLSLES